MHRITMLAFHLFAKCRCSRFDPPVYMLDAIDQIMRVFAFHSPLESHRFQANEADDVRVANCFRRDAIAAEQFRSDLSAIV